MRALFLHSWGASHHDWDLLAARFSEGRFPDLRGFGDAGAPPGPYDVASYADDVARWVEGWDEYALVGHSMGGKIALAFAARRPRGLARLVLVAPSPPTPEPMEEADRQANLAHHGDRAFAEATVEKIARAPLDEAVRRQVVDDYVRTSERAWRAWLEEGSKEDLADLMPAIEIPVHVVVGEEDPVMRPDMLRREVVARLRDASFETVPGAGHLLPLECPEALTEILIHQGLAEAGHPPSGRP